MRIETAPTAVTPVTGVSKGDRRGPGPQQEKRHARVDAAGGPAHEAGPAADPVMVDFLGGAAQLTLSTLSLDLRADGVATFVARLEAGEGGDEAGAARADGSAERADADNTGFAAAPAAPTPASRQPSVLSHTLQHSFGPTEKAGETVTVDLRA